MTLPKPLLALGAFALAAGLAAAAATGLVSAVETRSAAAVAAALRAGGHDWARVTGDGLQVVLEGEAPSEALRFRAMAAAGGVVDASRVIDALRVADARTIAPPDFAVEILRNGGGVSVIGLVPAATDRARLARDVAAAAGGQEVADLLQVVDHPVPAGWEAALGFAVEALADLPRAKLSVAPGRVAVEALADSPEERARVESDLARAAPEGLDLALAVSAPRPVIAPFTLRVRLEGGAMAFDACSADTEAARSAILAAASAAGAEGPLDCRLGLGAPSPDWGRAVAEGIAALHALGGGALAFSDADVALVAPPGTDGALFDRVAGELEGALPPPFSLRAELPEPAAGRPEGPPEFRAVLGPAGALRLEGRVADARMRGAAESFAKAQVGADKVTMATRVTPDGLPPGWSLRVLAGLGALGHLAEGRVVVTPDLITVAGRTGEREGAGEIARAAIAALGPGAELAIDVAYDEALDPIAGLPTPEECLARVRGVTAEAKITFDPGSATISAEGEPVVGRIAAILRACGDVRLRIAGHTDAQGGEASNLRLSRERAEAVLAALRAERVPVAGFEAVGFGEAGPIASNDTAAGREANRRIEFALVGEADGPAAVHGPPPPPATGTPAAARPLSPPDAAPPARPEAAGDGNG